jgi:hypothetical protein
MSEETGAARWGLPEGFVPVRFAIADDIKELLRPMLRAGEPAIVTLANLEGTISVVGTPQRLFVVRAGGVLAGVTGYSVREFPWQGVTSLTMAHAGQNVRISAGFRTSDGRTAEVGRRAALGQPACEHAMPFEAESGQQVFAALYAYLGPRQAKPVAASSGLIRGGPLTQTQSALR